MQGQSWKELLDSDAAFGKRLAFRRSTNLTRVLNVRYAEDWEKGPGKHGV